MVLFIKKLTSVLDYLLPTSCIICSIRQLDPICAVCLHSLVSLRKTPRCVICATPSHHWVCKSCRTGRWKFDASYCLAFNHSRLWPILIKIDRHGALRLLPGLIFAWEKIARPYFPPVDVLIPLPEAAQLTSQRGFSSTQEITRKLSVLCKTPMASQWVSLQKAYCPEQSNPLQNPFLIRADLNLSHLRIGVVVSHMESEYLLHHFAKILKSKGVLWVSNWVMVRIPRKEFN
ncbi:MAG: hypothetical protein HQ456_03940 [Polynucleobacter sp.]|nr:hypothetical protein [Polynucleobacter sp.]